jgi:hypothetical protein
LPSHPGLARVVDAWPMLPDAIRAGILAMIQTSCLHSRPWCDIDMSGKNGREFKTADSHSHPFAFHKGST